MSDPTPLQDQPLDDLDRRIVQATQAGLPLTPRPYPGELGPRLIYMLFNFEAALNPRQREVVGGSRLPSRVSERVRAGQHVADGRR